MSFHFSSLQAQKEKVTQQSDERDQLLQDKLELSRQLEETNANRTVDAAIQYYKDIAANEK